MTLLSSQQLIQDIVQWRALRLGLVHIRGDIAEDLVDAEAINRHRGG